MTSDRLPKRSGANDPDFLLSQAAHGISTLARTAQPNAAVTRKRLKQ
jgi:hypothetical protein